MQSGLGVVGAERASEASEASESKGSSSGDDDDHMARDAKTVERTWCALEVPAAYNRRVCVGGLGILFAMGVALPGHGLRGALALDGKPAG